MQLIDGKKIAAEIKKEIAEEMEMLKSRGGKTAHLVAVIVGNDPASETYVVSKLKACKEVGFKSTELRFGTDITEAELLEEIDKLNKDDDVDGFILQLPLPSHISEQRVLLAIDPSKDVDGFHPYNVGCMVTGVPTYIPATPLGITELIKRSGIETRGKNCVVIGRSNIVGTPMAVLMSRKGANADCTVTLCHSRTENLKEITRKADIIIVAMGSPRFLKGDMVSEGVAVIDVGIHREPSDTTKSGFKLVGDVDFDQVAPKASYITPVPGGVGPMTIVSLLQNTLIAVKNKKA